MSIDFVIEPSKKILGLRVVSPSVFDENRGSIWTSYNTNQIGALLPDGLCFKHDKFSISKNNVLRGIHGDHKFTKLVIVRPLLFALVMCPSQTAPVVGEKK